MKKTSWGHWADPPKAHAAEEYSEILETEVLVIGAGIAGMSCAYRAAQTGARVTVMEKLARYTARGFNVGVVNSSLLAKFGIHNDPDRKQVVDLVKRLALVDHLLVDTEEMLDPAVDTRFNTCIFDVHRHIINDLLYIAFAFDFADRDPVH